MITIQICNKGAIPEDVFNAMQDIFNKNALDQIFPKLLCKDITGSIREIGSIGALGSGNDGSPCIGLAVTMSLQLDETTGEIISVTLESNI